MILNPYYDRSAGNLKPGSQSLSHCRSTVTPGVTVGVRWPDAETEPPTFLNRYQREVNGYPSFRRFVVRFRAGIALRLRGSLRLFRRWRCKDHRGLDNDIHL